MQTGISSTLFFYWADYSAWQLAEKDTITRFQNKTYLKSAEFKFYVRLLSGKQPLWFVFSRQRHNLIQKIIYNDKI